MDQVHVIRHKVLREGMSIRAVARQLGVSRNTVAKYLQAPEPRRVGEGCARPRPALDAVAPRLEQLRQEWQGRTTAKQRLTGTRLHRQLPVRQAKVKWRRGTWWGLPPSGNT